MENLEFEAYTDPAVRCLFVKCTGKLTRENGFELADMARQDDNYENDFNVITDISGCEVTIKSEGLRQLATYINQKWPSKVNFTSAFIVDGPLNFGMARIYGAYSSMRVVEPLIFNIKQAGIKEKIKAAYHLPADYQFPEFLKFPE